MSIRVAIADDHDILVAALQALLASEPDITVVGTAGDGAALLALVAQVEPEVVIMDIGMPGMNGIEATQRLTAAGCAARVIMLSGHTDKRLVIEALDAGATGYLVKSSVGDELPRAIRSVAQGQTYLCPEVAGAVVETVRASGKPDAKAANSRLAPREREIVQLLAEGSTFAQIAAKMHIAPRSVDIYCRNILRKLGMHSVAEINGSTMCGDVRHVH